ncbi:MAG TPA: saccharopine dehydrogenase C-terminal domain-containing protein [Candidatus Nanoarchaeia archaeon]|nr:saccharopine dehydrogenase C-terminal domain-containing protein [Candidatus Nanoarchaeia archaeon]
MENGVIGILGLGAMGRIIAKDLASSFEGNVVYLVRDPASVKSLAKRYCATVRYADVSKPETVARALKGINVVIHAVHHEFNLAVMKACLKAHCHYLDLGGLFHFTREQLKLHNAFKRKGLLAILGMGAAPGITNLLARYGSDFLDRVEDVEILVGMKDKSTYKQVSPLSAAYSLQTILEEFSWKPAVFKNKKMVFVEPLSGRVPYKFPDPVGVQKPQFTIHSEVATLPFTLAARNVSFRIAFDDDFVERVRILRSLGLTEDREVEVKGKKVNVREFLISFLKTLPKTIPRKIDQYEIIRVVVRGSKARKKKELRVDAHIHGKDETIDKDTGVPPSIVAQMILKKKIQEKGVFPPDLVVPPELFFKELARRKIFIFLNNKRVN